MKIFEGDSTSRCRHRHCGQPHSNNEDWTKPSWLLFHKYVSREFSGKLLDYSFGKRE
jgi:hypothetical protein